MSYITQIADFYLARFPGIAILSPADYAIIAEWEKQKIPVAIVLRSINEVYYNLKKTNGRIESIGECEETVKRIFSDWLQKGII